MWGFVVFGEWMDDCMGEVKVLDGGKGMVVKGLDGLVEM